MLKVREKRRKFLIPYTLYFLFLFFFFLFFFFLLLFHHNNSWSFNHHRERRKRRVRDTHSPYFNCYFGEKFSICTYIDSSSGLLTSPSWQQQQVFDGVSAPRPWSNCFFVLPFLSFFPLFGQDSLHSFRGSLTRTHFPSLSLAPLASTLLLDSLILFPCKAHLCHLSFVYFGQAILRPVSSSLCRRNALFADPMSNWIEKKKNFQIE